jgi:plastocyanin
MRSELSLVRAAVAVALAALAVALSACGGAAPVAARPDGRFTVALDDFYLSPQSIRVPAGRLQVTVVNKGRIAHSFRLRAGADNQVLKISAIKPGVSFTRSFRLAPGRYTMFCAIGNHEELGMHGTLVVHK